MGALAEPLRRALYRLSPRGRSPLGATRPRTASRSGHTAKFHLERLVNEGLLDTEFRRLTGRTGPGAGRPRQALPPRRPRGRRQPSRPPLRPRGLGAGQGHRAPPHRRGAPAEAVSAAAAAAGAQVADRASPPDRRTSQLRRVAAVLEEVGYEPRIDDNVVTSTNCPFDRLASSRTELVCGLNLALVDAVADRLGCAGVKAELDPEPPNCCVRIRRT